MKFREDDLGDTLVLEPDVSRIDAAVAESFERELGRCVARGAPRVVLDLEHVEFIDSSGLGVLVRTLKRMRRLGRSLELQSPGPSVSQLLKLTRMNRVFTVHHEHDSSLAAARA